MARTDSDTLNYRGELFLIGQNKTPFLNMISGRSMRSMAFTFPLAQPYSLDSASQDVQSETTSATAGTPSTVTRAQDTNVCQIMKRDVAVTFKKQSTAGTISGINTNADQPVLSELGFQKRAALRQMAINMEYSFLNGTYVGESAVTDDVATRGIVTAVTTNTTAAGGATLDKDLFDGLMQKIYDTGGVLDQTIVYVNSWQKRKLTAAFDYVPPDRNKGGSNIMEIETDFGIVQVMLTPQMATDSLLIAEMSVCKPVFVPVSFNGEEVLADANGADVLWVKTAVTAAAAGGFYYTQTGLDYGPEEYHGTLTGLATS